MFKWKASKLDGCFFEGEPMYSLQIYYYYADHQCTITEKQMWSLFDLTQGEHNFDETQSLFVYDGMIGELYD